MHGAEGAEYGRFGGSVEVGSEREVERLPGVAAADTVDIQAGVALEVFHGGLGGGVVILPVPERSAPFWCLSASWRSLTSSPLSL